MASVALSCREDLVAPSEPDVPEPPEIPVPVPLISLIEVTISGIGTDAMTASAVAVPYPESGVSVAGPRTAAGSPMNGRTFSTIPPNGTIQLGTRAAQAVDVGALGTGYRYIKATFAVRNARRNTTPHETARTNLTFLAVATPTTIEGTAISQFKNINNQPVAAGLATKFLPAGSVHLVDVTPTSSGPDVLQVYHESELAAITQPAGVTSLLPYGFVTRNANTTANRILPADPATDQFDGLVTFAFKVPLQADPADDPWFISAMFLAVDDSEAWVTQSLEETASAATDSAEARAASLGAQMRAFFADNVGETPADRICVVRIADPDVSPNAFLVDSLVVTGQSPNPFSAAGSFVTRTSTLAASFNYDLIGATASSFAVNGMQSGRQFLSGGYTGGGTNTVTSAAGAFRAGEEIEVALTGGLSAQTGTAHLCHGKVARLRAESEPGATPESAFRVGGGPTGVAAFHLDALNAQLDLIVTRYDAGTVSIYLNTDGVLGTPSQTLTAGDGPIAAALGDVVGDGADDLVVLNQLDHTITIFGSAANPHNGFFTEPGTTIDVGVGASLLAVADIDNDGRKDIVTANDTGDPSTSSLTVRYGDGAGGFDVETVLLGHRPLNLTVNDVTFDGTPDIVLLVVPEDDPAKAGAVYTHNGTSLSGFLVDLGLVGPGAITVGDVNDDLLNDIVAVNAAGTVGLILGDENGITAGSTAQTWTFDSRGSQTRSGLALRLLDADTYLDAVVGNAETGDVSILRFDGTDFVAEDPSPAGVGMSTLLADDLVDPLDETVREIVVPLPGSDEILVLSVGHTGGATSPASRSFTLTNGTGGSALGDIDEDGNQDLVATGPAGAVTVFLGDGAGDFAAGTTVSTGGPIPVAVVLADLDGDGHLDVVTANPTSNNASVLLGDGAGGFASAAGSPFTAGTDPRHLAIGDVNGDGRLDVVVGNTTSQDVTVFLGDGAGALTPTSESPLSVGATGAVLSVALGDADQDRHLDLIVTHAGGAALLLGNGNGGFGTPGALALPWTPAADGLALGDVNGDGRLDIAVLSQTAEQAYVLLGNGSGGFAAAAGSPFDAGSDPRHLALGDTDGDGDLDLVVANPSSLSILTGSGTGTFGSERRAHVAPDLTRVLLGDLANTGRLDFVVTASNAVARLLSSAP